MGLPRRGRLIGGLVLLLLGLHPSLVPAQDACGANDIAMSQTGYVELLGAPRSTQLPLIVGLRPAVQRDPFMHISSAQQASMLEISCSSGLDFSGVHLRDVLDLVGWHRIRWIDALDTQVRFAFDGALLPEMDYEVTFLVATSMFPSNLSTIVLTWYSYDYLAQEWVALERSMVNQGRGTFPMQEGHMEGLELRSSSIQMGGLVSAGPRDEAYFVSDFVPVEVSLYLWGAYLDGMLAVTAFPPSAWDFSYDGGPLAAPPLKDGDECPARGLFTREEPGVQVNADVLVERCMLRRRGRNLNTVELHLAAARDASVTVTLWVPKPLAGYSGPWYAVYRSWGPMPEFAVLEMHALNAVHTILGPRPSAAIQNNAVGLPGTSDTLIVSLQLGMNMVQLPNSRMEVQFGGPNARAFQLEEDGCQLMEDAPLGAVVFTDVEHSICTVTWSTHSRPAAGLVNITADGIMTGADFESASLVGLYDPSNLDGRSWDTVRVDGGKQYIVKTRTSTFRARAEIDNTGRKDRLRSQGGTAFVSGDFDKRLEVGDILVFNDGEFEYMVSVVTSNSRCGVVNLDGSPIPNNLKLSWTEFFVRWRHRALVMGFNQQTQVTPVGYASFSVERFIDGAGFYSDRFTLRARGFGGSPGSFETWDTGASSFFLVRSFNGIDEDGDGQLDHASATFQGPQPYQLSPPNILSAVLHATTVAPTAKARILVSFRTGSSASYDSDVGDMRSAGTLIRLWVATSPAVLKLFLADGTGMETGLTEASHRDCGDLLLEAWGATGFPEPWYCWWDDKTEVAPSIYVRFRPGNGLRALTNYEIVLHATLGENATIVAATSPLVGIEIADGFGDRKSILDWGYARFPYTMVDLSSPGGAQQPIIKSLELVDSDPLPAPGTLRFRLRGTQIFENQIRPNNIIRLFLYPLTEWNAPSCTVTRSDGSPVICTTEARGHNYNVLNMLMDPNAPALAFDATAVFTVTGLSSPSGGFFRNEMGAEAWFNPRETEDFFAYFASSIDHGLSTNNFASAPPVSSGAGRLTGYSRPNVNADQNEVTILYTMPTICRAGSGLSCMLTLQAPLGFTVHSAWTFMEPRVTTGVFQLEHPATCSVSERTCTFKAQRGLTIWPGAIYGFRMVVDNPPFPTSSETELQGWIGWLSGSNRWPSTLLEEGRRDLLMMSEMPVILGRLIYASVVPDRLVCGEATVLTVQFMPSQLLPAGGLVRFQPPLALSIEVDSNSNCIVAGRLEWPEDTICTLLPSGTALLSLGGALSPDELHGFDITAGWQEPTTHRGSVMNGHSSTSMSFRIATEFAAGELDSAENVTWSAEVTAEGTMVVDSFFECFSQDVDELSASVQDLRPFEATQNLTNATFLFRWRGVDIDEASLEVRVIAPPGYAWEVQSERGVFDAAPVELMGRSSPLMLHPGRNADPDAPGANVMHMLSSGIFKADVMYGFTASLRVAADNPGSDRNPLGGNAWYMLFGAAAAPQPRVAAGMISLASGIVRKVSGLEAWINPQTPLSNSALSVAFTTVTSIQLGGILQVTLPPGYAHGEYLGSNCTNDASASLVAFPGAAAIPGSWDISCTEPDDHKRVSIMWSVGADGLPAGRYAVTVRAVMPVGPPGHEDAAGTLAVATFADAGGRSVADVAGELPAPRPLQPLAASELITAYLNPAAALLNRQPLFETWVVFAFGLVEDIRPDFMVQVLAPQGYAFAPVCQAHVGDGTTYTPLGYSSSTLPSSLPSYLLLPVGYTASCAGDGREAQIGIAPVIPNSQSSLPAVAGRQYLFRVQVTNAATTPPVNQWWLTVAGYQNGPLTGYELAEFKVAQVTPGSTALGEEHEVGFSFRSSQAIPGTDGLLEVTMPQGFVLSTVSGGLACSTFTGLYNVTPTGTVLVPGVECQGSEGAEYIVYIRNTGEGRIVPGRYRFGTTFRNPDFTMIQLPVRFQSFASAAASSVLDNTEVAGFAVVAAIRLFEVAPTSGQLSGDDVVTSFKFKLTSAIEVGDTLSLAMPSEYSLDMTQQGMCTNFTSALLPTPTCSGNVMLFNFIEARSSRQLPRISPFGTEEATLVSFDVVLRMPSRKPVSNAASLSHCRRAMQVGAANLDDPCPHGGFNLASARRELWRVLPELLSPAVTLSDPWITGTGQLATLNITFTAVSPGGTQLRVELAGMDFTGSVARYLGFEIASSGTIGRVLVTLPAGAVTFPTSEASLVTVEQAVNPVEPGPVSFRITTLDASGADLDQAQQVFSYFAHSYLQVQALSDCTPEVLLQDGPLPQCTSRNPWLNHVGNEVNLTFTGPLGATLVAGQSILIQSPAGFTYSQPAYQLLTGFPEVTGVFVPVEERVSGSVVSSSIFAEALLASAGSTGEALADDILELRLGRNVDFPFSLKVNMINPNLEPGWNYWRMLVANPDKTVAYTNDADWTGFQLRATFDRLLSGVTSLVSDFPQENNLVRLTLSPVSALLGNELLLKVTAPEGFLFQASCLATYPELTPAPSDTVVAWVQSCARVSSLSETNAALLTVQEMQAKSLYEVNLVVSNAVAMDSTAVWTVTSYRNNDLNTVVHYATLSTFPMTVMTATVAPGIRTFGESSMLHVSFSPARDLEPLGILLVRSPRGFTLFCSFSQFFASGNLPGGATCDGAVDQAAIRLSGSGFLTRGAFYHFAIQVTNPAEEDYNSLFGSGTRSLAWSVELQTQSGDYVHSNPQVAGYVPISTSILLFDVTPGSTRSGATTTLKVQFKLQTSLFRWQQNQLVLRAPDGYSFRCQQDLLTQFYVVPSQAISSANLESFNDISGILEAAPGRTLEGFQNEGTTDDGRPIVDCSVTGQLNLAISATDTSSGALNRYAFQVGITNAVTNGLRTAWSLQSYSEGALVEEAMAAGYELTSSTESTGSNSDGDSDGNSNEASTSNSSTVGSASATPRPARPCTLTLSMALLGGWAWLSAMK